MRHIAEKGSDQCMSMRAKYGSMVAANETFEELPQYAQSGVVLPNSVMGALETVCASGTGSGNL